MPTLLGANTGPPGPSSTHTQGLRVLTWDHSLEEVYCKSQPAAAWVTHSFPRSQMAKKTWSHMLSHEYKPKMSPCQKSLSEYE